MLHEVEDRAEAVREMIRVAKPGAPVIVRDLLRPPAAVIAVLRRLSRALYSSSAARMYTESMQSACTWGEWQGLAQATGLTAWRVWLPPFNYGELIAR
jgi:ubiquinone/menaquinone biosynthesis C-methylase UbiE